MDALDKAKELGREIVRQGAILLQARLQVSLFGQPWARKKKNFNRAFAWRQTKRTSRSVSTSVDYMDLIIYTRLFGYSGRDLLLTRSSDAVFIGCGRIGTIHEFTIAYEDSKPIGILEGDWDMDEVLKNIMEKSNRVNDRITFDSNPKRLVERVIALVEKYDRKKNKTSGRKVNFPPKADPPLAEKKINQYLVSFLVLFVFAFALFNF